MSFTNNVPVNADIEKIEKGVINSIGDPNHGKKAIIKLFKGYYSDGYKSGYIEHFWDYMMSVLKTS